MLCCDVVTFLDGVTGGVMNFLASSLAAGNQMNKLVKERGTNPCFILGRCLLIQQYFCAVYDFAGEADVSKGYWSPHRTLVVTTHFCRYYLGTIILKCF